MSSLLYVCDAGTFDSLRVLLPWGPSQMTCWLYLHRFSDNKRREKVILSFPSAKLRYRRPIGDNDFTRISFYGRSTEEKVSYPNLGCRHFAGIHMSNSQFRSPLHTHSLFFLLLQLSFRAIGAKSKVQLSPLQVLIVYYSLFLSREINAVRPIFSAAMDSKSEMIREQLFILILRLPEEKRQSGRGIAAMYDGGTLDFWRMTGQRSSYETLPTKIPHRLLCVGFYNLSVSKSNGCNIHSNWLSLLSPEMKEFLGS